MHKRAFLGPLAGGVFGAFLAFAAVSVLSFGALAQQIPNECLPFVSGGASGGGNTPSTGGWSPGPGGAGDNTYVGNIDSPAMGATLPAGAPFMVNGWIVDRSADGWAGIDQVQVFNGFMGQGGTVLANALVAQPRADVGQALGNPYYARSGFTATVTNNTLPQGQQTLNVYAHTPGKGWWYRSVTFTISGTAPAATSSSSASTSTAPAAAPSTSEGPQITIQTPAANERVGTGNDYTIQGIASDPAAPKGQQGIDRVEVWLNGERETYYARDIGQATLSGVDPVSWSVQFSPTKYSAQHSILYVYAHSKFSGKETVQTREFDIHD